MSRAIVGLLIFTVLVSACGPLVPVTSAPQAPLATQSLPDLGETWTLTMSHAGGIMGLSRSIEVSSDGKYKVTDEINNKTVKGQLASDEVAQLHDLLTAIVSNSLPKRLNSACADCFIYTIELDGTSKTFTAIVDDTTIADSGLEPLVTFLRDIMEKALK